MGYLPAVRSFETTGWIQAAAADLLVPSDAPWKGRWDRVGGKHSLGVSFVGLIGRVYHRGITERRPVQKVWFVSAIGKRLDRCNSHPASDARGANRLRCGLRCLQGPSNV